MGVSAKLSKEINDYADMRGYFYQRFEDAVSLGIPDAYLGAQHGHVWLELKSTATSGGKPHFERGQLVFGVRAHERGERARVLVANILRTPMTAPWLRLYRTSDIARSVIFREPWPEPLYAGTRLIPCLEVALED